MIKKFSIFIALAASFVVYWIAGIMVGIMAFPSELMTTSSDDGSILPLLLIGLLNCGVTLIFLYNSTQSGWKLILTTFTILFGLQYFMAQIESIWFNSALGMEPNAIYSIIFGGSVSSLLFAITSVLATGKFRASQHTKLTSVKLNYQTLGKIILLAAIVWPAVYFLAGYFIAWQFEAVRLFYADTSHLDTFYNLMIGNFEEGLYRFQILRGFLWIGIGALIIHATDGNILKKALIVALLLSVLSSSQLLISNPIMPEGVRMAHLLETSTSNFIWGIIITYVLCYRSASSGETTMSYSA